MKKALNDYIKKQLRIGVRPLACPKCGGVSMFKSALYWNCNSCDESWIEG